MDNINIASLDEAMIEKLARDELAFTIQTFIDEAGHIPMAYLDKDHWQMLSDTILELKTLIRKLNQ